MSQKAELHPFHDNLILTPDIASSMAGRIVIPEKAIPVLNQGKVLDKGPLVSDKINKGDTVFFAPHSESRIDWKGNHFIVVTESNCLGSITYVEEKDAGTKVSD